MLDTSHTAVMANALALTGGEPLDEQGTLAAARATHAGASGEVAAMVGAYVTALNLADARESQRTDQQWRLPRERSITYAVDPRTRRNQTYLRVTREYIGDGMSLAVHAFVEVSTGHLLKAAGWKAPARLGSRYSLLDAESVGSLRRALDTPGYFTGGYLYADRAGTY
jgi:ADP-ribosylglycohydrolase